MNRRHKIIISVTGIFLVLLILVGLTYAYFLTRIQGNTNEKSISVSTANLLVVYADGKPDVIETENIVPGEEVGTKEFTVENQGDAEAEYVVVIDNIKITDKKTEQLAEFESNDFVYTLECKSNQEEKTCEGQTEETMFPITNDGILIGNKIDVSEVQTYTLTVKYKETGRDQSNDMEKRLEARINIKNLKEVNPYKNNQESLAYHIVNNAAKIKTKTPIKMIPNTKPLEDTIKENEKELSITPDDYGMSYYYRGDVEDNYLEFANMCWRIVRIEGDGSVKLILASEQACSSASENSGYATNGDKGTIGTILNSDYGYKIVNGYYINDYINSTSGAKSKLNSWLKTKISESDLEKLKEEKWCIGNLSTAYDNSNTGNVIGIVSEIIGSGTSFKYIAGNRLDYLKTPKIRCETTGAEGEVDTNKIGMLTIDEVAFAGGGATYNTNYYLYKNATACSWRTLSPYGSDGYRDSAYYVTNAGELRNYQYVTYGGWCLRPAISIISGTKISDGNGTLENPYIIE